MYWRKCFKTSIHNIKPFNWLC